MSYSKEILFCTDILWCPLLKFRIGLFIKRLLDIQLDCIKLDSLKKSVGYCRFINIKNFFVFCAYVNYWKDMRTGISLNIYKSQSTLRIHIFLLGLEYKLVFYFLFFKNGVTNEA